MNREGNLVSNLNDALYKVDIRKKNPYATKKKHHRLPIPIKHALLRWRLVAFRGKEWRKGGYV
jgi:hypothetical protein